MSLLQAQMIADLVKTTLPDLGKGRYTPLNTSITDFVGYRMLWHKKMVTASDGYKLVWNLNLGVNNVAHTTALFQPLSVDIQDSAQTAEVPFAHIVTSWAVEDREVTMNSGASRIVDMIKMRRDNAMVDMIELVEGYIWGRPSSSSVTSQPHGIKNYITRLTDGGTAAFTSNVPTNWTTVANIDPTSSTYARWRNWAASYDNVTEADLIDKIDEACLETSFRNPIKMPDYGGNNADYNTKNGAPGGRGFYCGKTLYKDLIDYARGQNDNLGRDVVAYHSDGPMIKGRPVNYVPKLDSTDSTDLPLYGIDWNNLEFCFLKGFYQDEKQITPPNQPYTTAYHISSTYNLKCTNRRTQFIITKNNTDA